MSNKKFAFWLGKKLTQSHCAAISRAATGRKFTERHKRRISKALSKPKSAAHRKALKAMWTRPEFRAHFLASTRGGTTGERRITRRLRAAGWSVIRGGWPDLLAVRGNTIRAIEVKSVRARKLNPTQKRVHALLEKVGLRVEVLIEPNHTPKGSGE